MFPLVHGESRTKRDQEPRRDKLVWACAWTIEKMHKTSAKLKLNFYLINLYVTLTWLKITLEEIWKRNFKYSRIPEYDLSNASPPPPPFTPFLLHHHRVVGSKKSSVWIGIFKSVFLERLETAVEVKRDNSATSYFRIVAWPSLVLSLNIFRFFHDENSCKKPGGTSSNVLHIPLGLAGISSIAGYQT